MLIDKSRCFVCKRHVQGGRSGERWFKMINTQSEVVAVVCANQDARHQRVEAELCAGFNGYNKVVKMEVFRSKVPKLNKKEDTLKMKVWNKIKKLFFKTKSTSGLPPIEYIIDIEEDEDGLWFAQVRGVKGCHTQGATVNQAMERIRDALSLFVKNAKTVNLISNIKVRRAPVPPSSPAVEYHKEGYIEEGKVRKGGVNTCPISPRPGPPSSSKKVNTKENGIKDVGYDRTEFTIKVIMKNRWIPHFLAMLKYMQTLGSMGGSRKVSFYSDGDGDFRPKFEWDNSLSHDAKPIEDDGGNRFYDAG